MAKVIAPELAFGAVEGAAVAAPEIAATTIPEALTTTFGEFSPELFAANTAAVEAGSTAAEVAAPLTASALTPELTASIVPTSGVLGGEVAADPALGFFGQTAGGGLTSGTGLGPASDIGTTLSDQPFANAFNPDIPAAGGGGTVGPSPGSFGGGAQVAEPQSWQGFAPGVGENPGGTPAFGEATQQASSGPIVDTQAGANFGERFNASFGPGQTPNDVVSSEFNQLQGATPSNPGFMNNPTLNPSATASQFGTQMNVGLPVQGEGFTGSTTLDLTNALETPAQQAGFASLNAPPLPPPTEVTGGLGVTPQVPPSPIDSSPLPPATAPATVPSSPAAVANAPAAAAGGSTDLLNNLRMGAAGASIAASGLNIANALHQPSYTALQPIYYPGSTVPQQTTSGQFSGQTPLPGPANADAASSVGSGGIAGGLGANRLMNGLIAGQSPQQLAAEGLITPQRAAALQTDYQGIMQAYQATHGQVSPGMQQYFAAQALANNNLGGR